MNTPAPLMPFLLVAVGGALGALARYGLGRWIGTFDGDYGTFPWATFTANVVGSLLMGLLAGYAVRNAAGEATTLLLGVGLLGGFTTFSTFSLEAVVMLQRGQAGAAFVYVAGSVLGGFAALYIGLTVMRGSAAG